MSDQLDALREAADKWHTAQAQADELKAQVKAMSIDAHLDGWSDYRLAHAAGVTRRTLRAWTGKTS